MGTKNYTAESFGRRGAADALEFWKQVAAEAAQETARRAKPIARKLTPVGEAEARARKKAKAQVRMIDAWFDIGNLAGKAIFGKRYGTANYAAHAPTINKGREILSTGRMGGSTKARFGITRPLERRVRPQLDSIIAAAERRADRRT